MRICLAHARFVAVLSFWLAPVHPATAQRAERTAVATSSYVRASGIGAILDWLAKLSGPGPFVRLGLTYAGPTNGSFQARFTAFGGMATDSPLVRVVTVQPTVSLVRGSFEVATGIGANFFFGDDFTTFVQFSAPLQLVYRASPRIQVGGGFNYFAGFKSGAFGPAAPKLDPEAVVEVFLRFPLGRSSPLR